MWRFMIRPLIKLAQWLFVRNVWHIAYSKNQFQIAADSSNYWYHKWVACLDRAWITIFLFYVLVLAPEVYEILLHM